MDDRATEDFARCLERAELRARQLHDAALDAAWRALLRALARAWRVVCRGGKPLIVET